MNENPVDHSGHCQVVEVDLRVSIELSGVCLVEQGEVLYGNTVCAPEVIPPLHEGRVDATIGQILTDLVDTHQVIVRVPKGDVTLKSINKINTLHPFEVRPVRKHKDHKEARCIHRAEVVELEGGDQGSLLVAQVLAKLWLTEHREGYNKWLWGCSRIHHT